MTTSVERPMLSVSGQAACRHRIGALDVPAVLRVSADRKASTSASDGRRGEGHGR
jgi:hypothetical protein